MLVPLLTPTDCIERVDCPVNLRDTRSASFVVELQSVCEVAHCVVQLGQQDPTVQMYTQPFTFLLKHTFPIIIEKTVF